jgi:hypothetical protein
MRNWIPALVFASVALTVYFVLIPKPRRQERRWSTDGGDISLSSEHSGGGWSFGDWFGSDGDSGDGGGGGDGGAGD